MESKIVQILIDNGLGMHIRHCQVENYGIQLTLKDIKPVLHEKKKYELLIRDRLKDILNQGYVLSFAFEEFSNETVQPLNQNGTPIEGVKNIIAVASGKGGVGKSTISSNIAVTLTKMGFSVGFLDTDIYGPSAPIMFDVVDYQPLTTLVEGVSKMQPAESYGIKIMSLGFFTKSNQAVVWRGAMASKALKQMIRDTHWGALDFLILDLPPGTGDIHLSIVQEVPVTGSVIVSTPQTIALADAKKGVAMFQLENINVPVLGIIENMAYFTPAELPDNKYYIFGNGGAQELAHQLNIPFLGEIPLIQSIREATDIGRPVSLQTEESKPAQCFEYVVKNMLNSLLDRNTQLPPSEAVRITTMSGCSAVKKS